MKESAGDEFRKRLQEPIGYVRLALMGERGTPEREAMRLEALRLLREIGDDDDLIDRLYDEDQREMERFDAD